MVHLSSYEEGFAIKPKFSGFFQLFFNMHSPPEPCGVSHVLCAFAWLSPRRNPDGVFHACVGANLKRRTIM